MDRLRRARESGEKPDLEGLMKDIPYARFLGLVAELKGREMTITLPFKHDIVGNPRLPAIHGGVIGAFLEV
ncbi:MAG: hypothetical protein AAGB03_12235, partial [Pseudomonadota bacterium]